MARIYPNRPLPGTRSNAERKVFYALKEQLPNDYTVFHSVPVYQKLPRNGRLLDGEVDFVIAHPDKGIMVVEVKGGGITRDPDTAKWSTISSDGSVHPIKDPYEQGKAYCYSITSDLQDHGATRDFSYPAGHATWFPDISLSGRELGISHSLRLITLDALDVERTGSAIPRLFAHSIGSTPRRHPGSEGINALQKYFAPSWQIFVRISAAMKEEKETIVEATRSQYKVLSLLQRHKRALICGPAGSGKTFLAIEKAKRIAQCQGDCRVLIVCFNLRLAQYLRQTVDDSQRIDAFHFHGLCKVFAHKAGIEMSGPDPATSSDEYYLYTLPEYLLEALMVVEDRYDALIVDEGQDFDSSWWVPLMEVLRRPEIDTFYIFFDDNQLIYNRRMAFPIEGPPFILTENCRNTRFIHREVMHYYRGDTTPLALGPEGRMPQRIMVHKTEDERTLVERALIKLIKDEGVEARDIAIITPRREGNSIWKKGDILGGCVVEWNAFAGRNRNVLQCSTIHSFKGLESPVVILTETDRIPKGAREEMFYVAMSRANSHLVLVEYSHT